MKKTLAALIFTALVITVGMVAYVTSGNKSSAPTSQAATISTDGKQVIEITAKGGYSPQTTLAKADVPTIIKVKTNGTFDCSSALTIPSLGVTKHLPPSGETLIDVPAQKQGTTLRGLCGMGMYNFTVNFN